MSSKGDSNPSAEWEECVSKKHGRPFWFNRFTGESRWQPPDSVASRSEARKITPEVDSESRAPETADDTATQTESSDATDTRVQRKIDVDENDRIDPKCPANLQGKRDFLFRGFAPNKKSKFVIDDVASFSVTESQSADEMTKVILSQYVTSAQPALCILGELM